MRETISRLVTDAIRAAVEAGEIVLDTLPDPAVERPRDPEHGDWATTVALRASKSAKMSPRDFAAIVAPRLDTSPDVAAVEIAGPGFINVRLAPAALQRVLTQARAERGDFGRMDLGEGRRVQIEFVSANPVGPMHVGHGRWAAIGDALGNVLDHAGWRVEREFYVNDAGVQMNQFARSLSARYLELLGRDIEFPEDGYRGDYIVDIARDLVESEGDRWVDADAEEREVHFREIGYAKVLEHIRSVLSGIGVEFDVWFSERTLHAVGEDGTTAIERGIARLGEAGYIFEHEGATWFRSTDFGDDKDRVIVKADGEYTYFAADIAYHFDKLQRGFDRLIDIWGADHHGYVPRMKAAVAALGHPGALDIVIGQLVNLFRGDEVVRMSKRTGDMVTFEELLEEVGGDATRFFFLRRSTDQPVDFDIDLAKEQSSDNPMYYVQYAHARICSILRRAAEVADAGADIDAIVADLIDDDADLSVLIEDAELALMRKISELQDVVELAARDLAPYRLTYYAVDLASAFHQFYNRCRVMCEDPTVRRARLYAVDATRIALSTTLSLIGVASPTSM